MYAYLKSIVLLSVIFPLLTAYTCSPSSQFYIDCTNLLTLNQSANYCSQNGMTLLNITNSVTMMTILNQTLQTINCTNNFWYSYGNDTGLIANIGAWTGGLSCAIVPLLGLYCIAVPVLQAATVCTRTSEIAMRQKCLNDDQTQRFDLKKVVFIQKTIYATTLSVFSARTQSRCNSMCSRLDQCLGTNYQDSNCTLYF